MRNMSKMSTQERLGAEADARAARRRRAIGQLQGFMERNLRETQPDHICPRGHAYNMDNWRSHVQCMMDEVNQ